MRKSVVALVAVALISAWSTISGTASADGITYYFVDYPADQTDGYNSGFTDSISGTVITDGWLGTSDGSDTHIIGGELTMTTPVGTFTAPFYQADELGLTFTPSAILLSATGGAGGDPWFSFGQPAFVIANGSELLLQYDNVFGPVDPDYFGYAQEPTPLGPGPYGFVGAWGVSPPSGLTGSIAANEPWVIATVPEPTSLTLTGTALLGLGLVYLRRSPRPQI